MSLLDRIEGPNDLRKLSADQLPELAEEIRRRWPALRMECCTRVAIPNRRKTSSRRDLNSERRAAA